MYAIRSYYVEYPSRYKGLINCINDIHSKYLGEIHKITQENEKNRLLNAQVVHNAKLPVATLKLVLEDNIGSLDVITSYSIHYTKLYEVLKRGWGEKGLDLNSGWYWQAIKYG